MLTTPGSAAATAGNVYIDTGFNLRTPGNNTSQTFAGAALVLSPSAVTLANGAVTSGAIFSPEMIMKTTATTGPGGVGVDTANVVLNGGFVNMGTSNGTTDWAVLAGTLSVAGPMVSALGADSAEFLQVNSSISGTGALQIGGGTVSGGTVNVGQSQGTVILTSTNVNYSGVISVGSLVGTGATPFGSATANLQGSNSGGYNQNMLEAFGTGQINLYSAVNSASGATNGYTGITTLSLLSDGAASGGQTILVGSGANATEQSQCQQQRDGQPQQLQRRQYGQRLPIRQPEHRRKRRHHLRIEADHDQRIRFLGGRYDFGHWAGGDCQFHRIAVKRGQPGVDHQYVFQRREFVALAISDGVLNVFQPSYRQRRKRLEHRFHRRLVDAHQPVQQLHRLNDDRQRHFEPGRRQRRARAERNRLRRKRRVEHGRFQSDLRRAVHHRGIG